jgi:hypothetical protein
MRKILHYSASLTTMNSINSMMDNYSYDYDYDSEEADSIEGRARRIVQLQEENEELDEMLKATRLQDPRSDG